MRSTRLFLLFGLLDGVVSKAHVFQGSCDDALCAQLCLRVNEDTYECGCWNDHVLKPDGVGCRLNRTLSPIWHSVEEFPDSEEYHENEETAPVAFFSTNYAEFPVVESAYLETNITIEFKVSAQRDGILFFAGQFHGNDFISLALIGPNIMLRQDCGEGTIEDLYRGPFAMGVWHNVSIVRHYCYRTEVQADGRQAMTDEVVQFQNFKGITMDEGIFVGGAPRNVEFLDSKAGTDRGITGCIRKVIVNGEVLLFTEQKINRAVNQKHLDKCGVEKKERITKLEDVRKEDQFMEFDIATGFEEQVKANDYYGMFLEHFIAQRIKQEAQRQAKMKRALAEHAANLTHILHEDPSTTAILTTTTSTVVHLPSQEKHLSSAFFSGTEFLSWLSPADTIDYLELSLRFKPKSQAGLMFFWQDGSRHAAIYLRHGYVLVDVNMGSDSILLRSAEAVSLNSWHKVELWRSGRGLLLKVDHQTWVEGELQAIKSKGIAEGGRMFLGGVEGTVPSHLTGITGFHGCTQHLRVNGRTMKMFASNGIQECSSSTDPCASANCTTTCAVVDDVAVCLCEWPTYGSHCQEKSEAKVSAINFQGHSYLELKDEKTLSEITGNSLHFSMQLRVDNRSSEQMLLAFAGDHLKVDADFFRLKLVAGYYVQMEMNLGSGVVDLVHPTCLQPGKWHVISIVREKKHITLSVDDQLPITTVSAGASEQLNVYSSLFLGGLPTSSSGFHGCIASVDIGHVSLTQPSQASSAINVRECAV